ncbi:MAG: hypothetical protein ACXWT3_12980 [Methylococcaceae bacterium]
MPEAFSGKKEKARENQQQDIDELCRQIGQLIAEQDWLKKVFVQTLAARQLWIDSQDPLFSTRQQCHLLGINPSSLYYQPAGESEENLALMRRLDEQYTRTPCYGVLKMVATEGRGELRAALPDKGVKVSMGRWLLQHDLHSPHPCGSRAWSGIRQYFCRTAVEDGQV